MSDNERRRRQENFVTLFSQRSGGFSTEQVRQWGKFLDVEIGEKRNGYPILELFSLPSKLERVEIKHGVEKLLLDGVQVGLLVHRYAMGGSTEEEGYTVQPEFCYVPELKALLEEKEKKEDIFVRDGLGSEICSN